jgi:hypothetical protein
MNMTRAEIFGLREDNLALDDRVRHITEEEESLGRSDRPDLLWLAHSSLPKVIATAAATHYLANKDGKARSFAIGTIAAAERYFFGDWRTLVATDDRTINPVWWYGRESWMHVFRAALCWGSAAGDWRGLKRLSQYPDERRGLDTLDAKPAQPSSGVSHGKVRTTWQAPSMRSVSVAWRVHKNMLPRTLIAFENASVRTTSVTS